MTDKGRDPAFPIANDKLRDAKINPYGLTKREWFAGMAMMGTCANAWLINQWHNDKMPHAEMMKNIAEGAYAVADAMLEAGK